jgi:hypothetical protein
MWILSGAVFIAVKIFLFSFLFALRESLFKSFNHPIIPVILKPIFVTFGRIGSAYYAHS